VSASLSKAQRDEGDDHDLQSTRIETGGGRVELRMTKDGFDLGSDRITAWVSEAARAVSRYYGGFPLPVTRLLVRSSDRRTGVFGGTTWGAKPPFTRIHVGRHTSEQELRDDWMMTHELVHLAFPDVADEHHWIEEGLATYVEPFARVQIGTLTAQRIWSDIVRDMPKGEPEAFDQGLDHTHSWGRTYWGGALFCLAADVQIREATKNRKGLQDALRGILRAGANISVDWPLTKALKAGDEATGTTALTDLYSRMKDKPVQVDLDALWRKLGVDGLRDGKPFDEKAPLASVRRAMTAGVAA
jgi:hypothetical protein